MTKLEAQDTNSKSNKELHREGFQNNLKIAQGDAKFQIVNPKEITEALHNNMYSKAVSSFVLGLHTYFLKPLSSKI